MTYVDERVVELRFNNKQFEQETAKSMSTLDKLKEKLNFKNAQSGAEQLQKAVANINVNPVLQGIGAIETKMSSLGIAGKRVIENLVDWAMSGVNKVINKLNGPINQIITGGKSRAQNIEQAKFQLEGLGVAWTDIEEDISYGVQDTAYGLDAAAKVASQLVASQVELGDEMKHALLGISGVAAMTNSTYEDIGRVYTNVAGNGRLMGEQLLQLSSRGINAAATLAKALNTTEAEVRDMVSKGKISFQMFSDAMFEAFGEHAKSANKTFQGALSNTKAALSRLGADVAAQGFNSIRDILNEIIPKLKEFKKGVKPLEDAIIKMVDAVGKLVQAFVKAVDIQKIIDALVPKMEKFVNVCTEWVTAYRQVFTGQDRAIRGNTAFIEEQKALGKITQSTKEATEATLQLSNITAEQKEMAREIWEEGKYGTGDARREALGKDYEMVQAYINEMIALGWDQEAMEKKLTKAAEEEQEAIENLAKTERKRQVIVKITAALSNLKTVAKNVFTSVKNVLTVAFDSMRDVFFKGGSNNVGNGIVSFTGSLARFSEKIKITEERAQKLKPIFNAIFTIFKAMGKVVVTLTKGLAKVVSVLATLINKVAQSKIIKTIFDAIKNAILSIGTALKNIYTKLKENGVWDKFVGVLKIVVEWLGERLVDAFKLVGTIASAIGEGAINIFGSIADRLKAVWEYAKEALPWLQKIVDFFKEDILSGSWLTKLKELLVDIFGSGKDIFQRAFDMGSDFINGLVSGLKNLSLEDAEKISKIIAILGTAMAGIKWLWSMSTMNNALANMTGNLTAIFETLNITIKKYGKRADAERFKAFADSIVKIVGSLIALMVVFAALEGLDFDADRILDKCKEIIYVVVAIIGVTKVLVAILSKATNDNSTTYNILPKLKLPTLTLTLLALGYLVQVLVNSVMNLYKFTKEKNFDSGKMWSIVAVLGGLLLVIGTLTVLAIKFSKATSGMEGLALTLLSIGVLISLLVKSFKKVIDVVKESELVDVATAVGIIESFLWPVFIFAAGVMAINGALPQKGLITNPFRGMFSMFISLAALIRLALVPLLNTLVKANREGDAGIDAIGDFQDILKSIELFVFGLAAISLVLSRTINAGGFSTMSKTGPILGVAAIVASLAFVFSQMAKIFKNVKEVDSHTLSRVRDIITTVEWFIGIMTVLVSVGSAIAGPAVIGGLLALAAVIASVGLVMLSAGVGFKLFQEGLVNLISSLPSIIDRLLEFFNKVNDNKDTIKQGIIDTVSLMVEGAIEGMTAGLTALAKSVPLMVEAMAEAFISAINSLADTIFDQGDDFVDATNRLTAALAYLFLYANDHAFEWFKQGLKEKLADTINEALPSGVRPEKGWGDRFGKETTTTGVIDDPEQIKALYGNKGKEDAKNAADSYLKGWEQQRAKEEARMAKIGESESNSFSNAILGDETADKVINSKIGKKVQKWFDVDLSNTSNVKQYAKDLEKELGASFDTIKNSYLTGDMTQFTKESGYNITYEQLQGMVDGAMDGKTDVVDAIDQIDWEVGNAEDNTVEDAFDSGERWSQNLANGVTSKQDAVINASADVQNAVLNEINSYKPKMYDAAINLVEGYKLGLHDAVSRTDAYRSVADLGTRTQDTLKKILGEHSPSKNAAVIGEYFVQGFINGILDLSSAAETATEDVGEESMTALQMILDRLFNTTMENMDISPTITPVLDLSQVEAGITSMNGMFDNNSSYGLAFGNATAYNNGLSAKFAGMKVQNEYDGANVVDAVNSLRNDISEIKTAMGTLGFYVDGKQMATAIADPMNSALNKIAVNTGRGVK